MLLTSIGYSELNKADPDCGTTFAWAARAFGPRTGWAGGWGIIVADVLVMSSLAQVASQYVFFLFGANGIGANATSGWVLLGGIIWIVLMTVICYVGIEVSANFQKVLLTIELVMLVVLSITALVKAGNGSAPAGHLTPSLSWFNPFHISSFSALASGVILMVFIYWGWDTAVAVNEETTNKHRTPGLAAIFSTIILLVTSQTTILPTARTPLSVAAYRAIPKSFAKVHPRFLTPTVSTVAMGLVSILVYVGLNYSANGAGVIGDAVIAIGLFIAFYYGLTGFTCAWYYRRNLTSSARNLWMQGIHRFLAA